MRFFLKLEIMDIPLPAILLKKVRTNDSYEII